MPTKRAMGTIKATVWNIYVNSRAAISAYFSSTTKPIFRTESARYVLLVQMPTKVPQYANTKISVASSLRRCKVAPALALAKDLNDRPTLVAGSCKQYLNNSSSHH